mgnify:FL=1
MTIKKYKYRNSPPYSANQYCGKKLKGNDGNLYISKEIKNGQCRWFKINKEEKSMKPMFKPGLFSNKKKFLKWKIIKQIGKGSFGHVYLTSNIKTNEKVAIKVIRYNNNQYIKEIETLKKIYSDCKSFLCFKDVGLFYIKDDDNNISTHIYLVTEVINGVELYKISWKDNMKRFEKVFYELVKNLQILHNKYKIAHNDIKPENILINKNKGMPKIIDFGLICDIPKCHRAGTPAYMFAYDQPEKHNWTLKSRMADDIFALGMTLYESLRLYPDFFDPNFKNNIEKELKEKNIKLNPIIKNHIDNMLNENRNERIKSFNKIK